MRRSRGFTIIELVISTALMSMILGAAYVCLRAGIATQQTVQAREEALQSGRIALARLSADLRSACPLSKEFEFIGMQRTVGKHRADNLDFATHNYKPVHTREADWCEVSYFLEKDPSGQFSLWRRRDATPDNEPFAGGTREEIAQGLLGLKLEYYDGFEWFDEWGDPQGKAKQQNSQKTQFNLSGLPEAVRMTLWIQPRARHASAASNQADRDEGEPPLMFQTVARLNLAAASETSAGSSSSSSTNSPGPIGQSGPAGPSSGGAVP